MSVKVSSAIWEYSTYKQERLLVLLALADWANDDGFLWPSVAKIAAKSRLSERGVIGILKEFKESGVIEIVQEGGGRGNVHLYRIKGEAHSGFSFLKGEADVPKRVNLTTKKGERGDIAIRKEPSVEPSISEPSAGSLFETPLEEKPKEESKPTRRLEDVIESMFDYYCRKMKKTDLYTLTPKRMKMALARFNDAMKKSSGDRKEAFLLMRDAIDAMACSDWHNGKNPGHKKYNDWEQLFRSTEDFERWLERAND